MTEHIPSLRNLPFDIFCLILQFSEITTLVTCTLVSRAIREAARPWLFRTITLKDMSCKTLNYSIFNQLDDSLKGYVREVVHIAPTFPPTLEGLNAAPWQSSIRDLKNLNTYTLSPTGNATLTGTALEMAIDALQCSRKLRHVYINSSLYSYHIPSLRRLPHIPSITLNRPSRSVISQMPSWLDAFTPPLKYLTIIHGDKFDCEAIISWTSESFPAHLASFTLGRGHKLQSTTLMSLIRTMPNLTHLDIFYDNFILSQDSEELQPSNTGPLLKHLVVRHQGVALRAHFYALFEWIRAIIVVTPSPLKTFRIISDDGRLCGNTVPLMKLLASDNLETLDTIRIPHVMLKNEDLLTILGHRRGNRRMKEFEFYLWDHESIDMCIQHRDPTSLVPNLAVLRWTTQQNKQSTRSKIKDLVEALGHCQGSLRARQISKAEWRGMWSVTGQETFD